MSAATDALGESAIKNHAAFIWSVADLLRGDYKQSEYGNVILPLTVLPDQLFYNTGISTYFWVVTNRKRPERRGKVQLVDARTMFTKMRKSRGEKRKRLSDVQIAEVVELYGNFEEAR